MTLRRQGEAVAPAVVTLELPYPPTVNHYWRRLPSGKVVVGSAGRTFRTIVRLKTARCRTRLAGRLRVDIWLVAPRCRRHYDVDNCLKAILDALERAEVYLDDEQIEDLRVRRRPPRGEGAAIVSIEEIEGEAR